MSNTLVEEYVEETYETPESTLPDLTGHDRCDRCPSQAYVRVELPSGFDLVFCGHHYHVHQDVLESTALRIRDETSRLIKKPSDIED